MAFRYRLDDAFAATGEVWRPSGFPDVPPVLVTNVFVGVSYEPLRRLSPLLDLFHVSVVDEDVWPEVRENDDDENGERGEEPLEVRTAGDAARAAERFAPLILDRARPFAAGHASLDALLAEFSGGDITYTALLAAAGRFDEARESLERLPPPLERSEFTRGERRAVRQLKRWIESGGDPSLIPSSLPPNRLTGPKPKPFSELWSESRARSAAVKETRAAVSGKSREQARTILRDALARRAVRAESPLWVENTLDHLWDSPGDRAQLGIQMFKGAARFGLGVVTAIRDRQLPDLSTPDWLEPPDHALYEVPRSNQWIAAELDPNAGPWLDRVHQAAPHAFGTATVTAWLHRAENQHGVPGVVDVRLGEQRVGRVPPSDVHAYLRVLADASARDEYPCIDARLTRRDTPIRYLLELATTA